MSAKEKLEDLYEIAINSNDFSLAFRIAVELKLWDIKKYEARNNLTKPSSAGGK